MGNVVQIGTEQKTLSAIDQAKQVLEFLNAKTKRNFRPVQVNLDFILARLREGYTVQDLKSVTAMKVREWLVDENMTQFLRPATLYNRTNFSQYVGFVSDLEGNPE